MLIYQLSNDKKEIIIRKIKKFGGDKMRFIIEQDYSIEPVGINFNTGEMKVKMFVWIFDYDGNGVIVGRKKHEIVDGEITRSLMDALNEEEIEKIKMECTHVQDKFNELKIMEA